MTSIARERYDAMCLGLSYESEMALLAIKETSPQDVWRLLQTEGTVASSMKIRSNILKLILVILLVIINIFVNIVIII